VGLAGIGKRADRGPWADRQGRQDKRLKEKAPGLARDNLVQPQSGIAPKTSLDCADTRLAAQRDWERLLPPAPWFAWCSGTGSLNCPRLEITSSENIMAVSTASTVNSR
jgi:hypothetical protein